MAVSQRGEDEFAQPRRLATWPGTVAWSVAPNVRE